MEAAAAPRPVDHCLAGDRRLFAVAAARVDTASLRTRLALALATATSVALVLAVAVATTQEERQATLQVLETRREDVIATFVGGRSVYRADPVRT